MIRLKSDHVPWIQMLSSPVYRVWCLMAARDMLTSLVLTPLRECPPGILAVMPWRPGQRS